MKTDQNKIEVGNIVVDVVRKNIKNLHLRVYRPTGRVRISAPMQINDETIREIQSHLQELVLREAAR